MRRRRLRELTEEERVAVERLAHSRTAPARQVQALGLGQCGGDHPRHLLGRVGRRPTGAGLILEPDQALGVEPLDPVAHRVDMEADLLGNPWHVLALAGVPDDARPLDLPRGCGARPQPLMVLSKGHPSLAIGLCEPQGPAQIGGPCLQPS